MATYARPNLANFPNFSQSNQMFTDMDLKS